MWDRSRLVMLGALVAVLPMSAACGSSTTSADDGGTPDGRVVADGGADGDGSIGDGDGGRDDGGLPGSYDPVGTPAARAGGRGGPPIVLWPKPVYAHPEVPFEFTMVAYDEEHDRLVYGLRDAPAGMTIDENGTIRWTPDASASPYVFTIEVDDGRGEPVTIPVTLTVDADPFLFVAPDGSDAADGTLASPLRDLDAAMRALVARGGGTLYVRGGTYDVTWDWERGGVTSPFRSADGSPDAPYIVRGYPGEAAVIDCGERGHGLWAYGGSNIVFADLEVRGASSGERGGAMIESDDSVMQNVTVRDSNWSASNNCTGFLLRGRNATCHRCRAYDNYDRTSDHWNSSNYLVYTDTGDDRTIYILDSLSENSISGFKMKHAGPARLVLHGSRDVGSNYGWAGMDDETTIRFNTFVGNDVGIAVGITDPNTSTAGGMVMENDTVVDADVAFEIQGASYASDGVTLRRNVLVVAGEPGGSEGTPHFAWVWPYEDAVSASLLTSDENCFFGSRDDVGFRLGRAEWGLAEWRASGHDVTSVFGDPTFAADGYTLGDSSPCRTAAERVGAWE